MSEASHTPTAVIVGARGFIGRALARRFQREGVPTTGVTRNDPLEPGAPAWEDVLGATTIYWCASTINPSIAEESPDLVRADRERLRRFLADLAGSGSTARVVLLSSGGTVYGDAGSPPYSERTVPRPTTAYGLAKLALERDLRDSGPPTSVAVRISNAYGPGQRAAPGQGVLGHWLRAAAAGRPIHVFGDLRPVRDYLYVDDLVDGLARVHTATGALPPVVNLGSGTPTTLGEVLAVVQDVVADGAAEVEIAAARSFDADAVWLDTSTARSALGWSATTDLLTGTRAMWSWVRDGERPL